MAKGDNATVKSDFGPVVLYANALFADRDDSFTTNSMKTALRETQNITLA